MRQNSTANLSLFLVTIVAVVVILEIFGFFMLKILRILKMSFFMFFSKSLLLCILNVNLLEQVAQSVTSDRIGHDSEFG